MYILQFHNACPVSVVAAAGNERIFGRLSEPAALWLLGRTGVSDPIVILESYFDLRRKLEVFCFSVYLYAEIAEYLKVLWLDKCELRCYNKVHTRKDAE